MALSAAGLSGSRRQNSAYSPTGIGDTFFELRVLSPRFFQLGHGFRGFTEINFQSWKSAFICVLSFLSVRAFRVFRGSIFSVLGSRFF